MRHGQATLRAIGRRPTKVGVNGQRLRVPIATHDDEMDEGAIDHFWHPDREGVEQTPESFTRMLADVSADVRVVRPPVAAPLIGSRAWLIWYVCPRVTHPLSPGWLMLRDWRDRSGQPLPLDNRVFSYLYSVSARAFGNGRRYWEHCMAERQREIASRERHYQNAREDQQNEFFASHQIKNIGSGNKFALHHDGTVFPSRGQENWHREMRRRVLPSELIRSEDEARERQREARG